MAENNKQGQARAPLIRRRRRISWVWLVPLVAALIGLSLLVRGWLETGPTVTIRFDSAEGLEVGQTKVRYKDVVIGHVTNIGVSPNRDGVLVKAELDRNGAKYFTREGTYFWVVRPRFSLTGISGLSTILSGPYISVDPPAGEPDGSAPVYEFVGLEKPPEVTGDRPGKRFTVVSDTLGSLEIGSPIYYRDIPVGRVIGYELSDDGDEIYIHVFIDSPNDKFVTSDTRFWNVSGIDFSFGSDGVQLQTASLASIVAGGIAFASINPHNETPAPADTVFTLSADADIALAEPNGPPFRVDMVFNQPVRGLTVGAPIEFLGMEVGKVYDIDLDYNPSIKRFYILVKTHFFPLRFGEAYDRLFDAEGELQYPGHALLGPLIEHGLRAQLQTSNLLTGQKLISLNFFPDADPADYSESTMPLVIPTIAGDFDRLQEQIANIVKKIDAVPFDGISNELIASMAKLRETLDTIDTQVAPQAAEALKAAQASLESVNTLLSPDSNINVNLERTMREINSVARSLRNLSDYLQAHPSSLLRGRAPDQLPPPTTSR